MWKEIKNDFIKILIDSLNDNISKLPQNNPEPDYLILFHLAALGKFMMDSAKNLEMKLENPEKSANDPNIPSKNPIKSTYNPREFMLETIKNIFDTLKYRPKKTYPKKISRSMHLISSALLKITRENNIIKYIDWGCETIKNLGKSKPETILQNEQIELLYYKILIIVPKCFHMELRIDKCISHISLMKIISKSEEENENSPEIKKDITEEIKNSLSLDVHSMIEDLMLKTIKHKNSNNLQPHYKNDKDIIETIKRTKNADKKNRTISQAIWQKIFQLYNLLNLNPKIMEYYDGGIKKDEIKEKLKLLINNTKKELKFLLSKNYRNKKLSPPFQIVLGILLEKIKYRRSGPYYKELMLFIRKNFFLCNTYGKNIFGILPAPDFIFFALCSGYPQEALKFLLKHQNDNRYQLKNAAKDVIRENYFPTYSNTQIPNDTTYIIKGFIKHAGIEKVIINFTGIKKRWKLHSKYTENLDPKYTENLDLWKELQTLTEEYYKDKSKLPQLINKVAHLLDITFRKLPIYNELSKNREEKGLASLTKVLPKLMPTELAKYKNLSKVNCFLDKIKNEIPHDNIINTKLSFFILQLYKFLEAYYNVFLSLLIEAIEKNPNSRQKLFDTYKNNITYLISAINEKIIIAEPNKKEIIIKFYEQYSTQKKSRKLQLPEYGNIVSSTVKITREPIALLIKATRPYTGPNPKNPIPLSKDICNTKIFSPIKQILYKTPHSQLLTMLPELNTKNPIIAIKHNNNEVKTAIISGNVILIGDIHGDFESLVTIISQLQDFLNKGGKVVFLGDLIDRRSYVYVKNDWSIAVVSLVLQLYIEYKNQVIVLRGNHEYEEVYYGGGLGYGFNWFIKITSNLKEVIQHLNSIFNQFPITLLHLSKKGITSMSHGAPFYTPKSLIELLSGGFLTKPYNSNNCTWNGIKSEIGDSEGKPNPRRKNAGILVGEKTKAALEKMKVIRHVLGHLHVNKAFYDFFYSISSGDFREKKHSQNVGLLTNYGDFHYIDDINDIKNKINAILN